VCVGRAGYLYQAYRSSGKKLVYATQGGRIRQAAESSRVLLGPSLPALQTSCMRSIAATIPGISLDFSSVTGDVEIQLRRRKPAQEPPS